MAKQQKTYWPHMILGFLFVGISLGYWTVKSSASRPVQYVNDYMTNYQDADIHYNDIMRKKALFDKRYTIALDAKTYVQVPIVNSKAKKSETAVLLHKGANSFVYRITDKNGRAVADANVSFLLTRPHTDKDNVKVAPVGFKEGAYRVENIEVKNPGRYTLELKATVGDATGYSSVPAYLKP